MIKPPSNITTLKPSVRDRARLPLRLRLYRPKRLAQILDVDPTTINNWQRTGVLPPPVRIGGITGWTEETVAKLLRQGGAGTE